MNNILFIVGLPASGKSTFASKINIDNDNKYRIIDDPKDFKIDILPYINEDLIITDPNLCFEKNRKQAITLIEKNSNARIDWIFFENDPESCLSNASRRVGKKVDGFIRNLSQFYEIPSGSSTTPVFKSF